MKPHIRFPLPTRREPGPCELVQNEDEVLSLGGHQSAWAWLSLLVLIRAKFRDQCADGAIWRTIGRLADAALTDPTRGGTMRAVPNFRINQRGARPINSRSHLVVVPPQEGWVP